MNNIQVSLFPSSRQTTPEQIELAQATEAIKSGNIANHNFQDKIKQIRSAEDKGTRDKLKKLLPGVTFSGTFKKRTDRELIQHNGLLCFDFDNVADIEEAKARLCEDVYTYMCFISPSGKGIKLIVKTTAESTQHKAYYQSLCDYYYKSYNLTADIQCKNISRLCFLSYDPDVYTNPEAIIYKLDSTPAEQPKTTMQANTAVNVYEQVEHCISQIEKRHLDITTEYGDWQNIAFALANQFGEAGRSFFHRVSCFYTEYDATAADEKYSNAITSNQGKISIATFFNYCKRAEISISLNKNKIKDRKNTENNTAKPSQKEEKNTENPYSKGKSQKSGGSEAKINNPFIQVEEYLKSVYDFRLNDVNGELEYRLKNNQLFEPCREENIYVHLQRNGIKFSQNNLRALLASDFVPIYDPILHYFKSLPVYDSKNEPDYIAELCTYIKAREQKRFNNNFRKMLVRSIACSTVPGVFNKQAFILVHNKQNSGKSTFCRWLCPPVLEKYYSETFNGDKDSMTGLSENFIINLDELASLHKIEINALKTAISKDSIKIRRPYDKRANTYPRRANFVGSTNDLEFLTDKTGNVRWLCFEIEKIDFDYKKEIDINRLWAQANYLFNSGYDYLLTSGELKENEEANESHQVSDPVKELIQKYFEPGVKKKDDFMTTTEINEYLKTQSYALASNHIFNNKNIGMALVSLGFSKSKHGNTATNQRWGYYVKKIKPFEKPTLNSNDGPF